MGLRLSAALLVFSAGSLCSGANRTASVTQHNLSLNIGYAVNGTLRLYFSTYDGSHTWARYQTGVGWSGELRPDSPGSPTYRSDYDIYNTADGLFYGYGSITVGLPTGDSDGDLLPDFLDRSRGGSASFSGTATEYLAGVGTSSYAISGSINRAAGSTTGSYSVSSSGGAVSYGNFAIAGSTGTVTYDPDARTMTIQVRSFDGTETVSAQTSYSVIDSNRIRVNGFTAQSSAGSSTRINTFELTRTGNRYAGRATVADGNASTSWVDYNYYHLKVVDGNDSDGDGIPDLSDTSNATPPVIVSQPSGGAFLGGQTISLSVNASGSPAPTIQWFKDGVALADSQRVSGSRSANLLIASSRRADSGNYFARLSNSAGSIDSSAASIRVRVPQRCDRPVLDGQGTIVLRFGDEDGGALDSSHSGLLVLQWSTNLIHWQNVSGALTASDGKLEFRETGIIAKAKRFYRVMEP